MLRGRSTGIGWQLGSVSVALACKLKPLYTTPFVGTLTPAIFENFAETTKNDRKTSGAGNTVFGSTTAAKKH